MNMTLLYDNLVYSLQKYGGISTYWYELSTRFLKADDIDIRFFETGQEINNICRSKLNISPDQVINSNRGGIQIERFLRLHSDTKAPHIFHSSYFRLPSKKSSLKTVCTVHDFIHDLYFSGPRVWLHNMMKSKAINESDIIITVSENTKNDLLKFYPKVNPANVKMIYNGVSDSFRVLENLSQTSRPYFLYVGIRDDYKNFKFAVELANDHREYDLYIVGPKLTKKEIHELDHMLPGRYKSMTAINEASLNELYNNAFCLLYPSEYEGFGIPILEAMRAGCPFIALNKSAVPEVAGNAGVLIHATDLDAGREAVDKIVKNRTQMINLGLLQSEKFSWDSCFEQTEKIYKSLL